jgi:hypothetical protein
MAFEGHKLAKKLRSDGWNVDESVKGTQLVWNATHEDTHVALSWGPNPHVQPILREAAAALDRPVARSAPRARKVAEAERRAAERRAQDRHRAQLLEIRDQKRLTEKTRRRLMAEEDNFRFYEQLMQPGRR